MFMLPNKKYLNINHNIATGNTIAIITNTVRFTAQKYSKSALAIVNLAINYNYESRYYLLSKQSVAKYLYICSTGMQQCFNSYIFSHGC